MAHAHNHKREGNLKIAFLLNFLFTLLELAGGLWTNSMAILSDAVHDLGDSLSLGAAWYLERRAGRGPDQKYSFGYARFSLLGALVSSAVLVAGSVVILIRAVPRLFHPEEVNAGGMLVLAVIGIVVNGIAALRVRKGTSLNEKIVSWHLFEDVLGWAAVLVAGVVLLFADIPVLDPILSVAITLYILVHVVRNLKSVLGIFLQGVPAHLSIPDIERDIAAQTGAASVHHTHIWSLEGERNLLSTHITVPDGATPAEIAGMKQEIRTMLREQGIEHVTVQIDFESETCEDPDC